MNPTLHWDVDGTAGLPWRKVAKVPRARGAPAMAIPIAAPMVAASVAPMRFTISDLRQLVTQILQAQAKSNLQLHQSFQTNMLANIRTTLTALVAMQDPPSMLGARQFAQL